MTTTTGNKRVVIVTGGGAGIGGAIAEELARRGDHVVTVDPLVAVDGTNAPADQTPTTAERILEAGGSAESSNTSVTDAHAMSVLVEDLLTRHGRLDAVVNAAGISRPTGFAKGDEPDWSAVIEVHLQGYINVLAAVMPHFAEVGAGHVVGVTSGSGWRTADAGAYGCAKRAVAALTWKLGRHAPHGVHVNAISPIAMTRMVTSALKRTSAAPKDGARVSGGLALGALPPPEQLGPLGAAMAGHTTTPHGRILFAGGSEIAVLREPQLMEIIRTSDVQSVDSVVSSYLATLIAAEKQQTTTGGANPRFSEIFNSLSTLGEIPQNANVLVVSDQPQLAATLTDRITAHGSKVHFVSPKDVGPGFAGASSALRNAFDGSALDVVFVALSGSGGSDTDTDWHSILNSHTELGSEILADARWARACADYSAEREAPLRLVNLVDARKQRGSTRAQTSAQLFRAARGATSDRVSAFTIAIEDPINIDATVALALTCAFNADAVELSGAELAIGHGWLGLRSHPSPTGSLVFGGPDMPLWFGDVLEEMCQ